MVSPRRPHWPRGDGTPRGAGRVVSITSCWPSGDAALSAQQAGGAHSVDAPDKGVILDPGATEQGRARFHHTTENSMPLKTCNLLLKIFPFYIFRLQLAVEKGALLYKKIHGLNNQMNPLFLKTDFINDTKIM